ncbi:4-hydroxy-tetrahydrodipicolinate reductase [Heyndrickxia faecalis]|uniref:4-hydroxy-tetrahydrodipicolinate reductase n=1 Tax=Heyndrickxia faecalis TaxID=2824910 RepID=A0AAU7WDR2_9BACI
MDDIRIIVAGARGKMGSEAVRLIERTEHFKLVGVVDRTFDGKLFNDVSDYNGEPVRVYTDPEACLENCPADVWIDLTVPKAGFLHAKTALAHGVRPVVGTTGFTDAELEELKAVSAQKRIGCIIAPNFAIGAVLMMKFAQMAAKYFPDVEIIELHHDRKKDAPSGTSVKTAQMISEARRKKTQGHPDEKETLQGARGADFEGMHIHSVRLPGLVAHQEVLFGGDGQLLTIRHDSMDRASFMSGVKVAVETVMNLNTFVYGLENILD